MRWWSVSLQEMQTLVQDTAILLKVWIPILESLEMRSKHPVHRFLFDKSRSSSSKETRATAVDLLLFLSIDVAKLSASVRISSKLARFSFDSFDPSESEKSESSTTGVPPDDFAPSSALKATVDSADTLRANPTKDKDSVVHANATQRRRTTRCGSKDRLPGLPRTQKKLRTFESSFQRLGKTKTRAIEVDFKNQIKCWINFNQRNPDCGKSCRIQQMFKKA